MKSNNEFSHLTAKKRTEISFSAQYCWEKGLIYGNTLDYGCGFGLDVEELYGVGVDITGYDPYYFPKYPTVTYDTILCTEVLNVLLPEEQATVLMEISRLLRPDGRAYFTVRRDVDKEGFQVHKILKKPLYLCNVKLSFRSILRTDTFEIYEYQHYNQLEHPESDCPFCHPDSEQELIVETASAYALFDNYPVSAGHALVIPKRHVSDYFQLTFKEQTACWFMVNKVKEILQHMYAPQGFNVGINVHTAAGQTIPHVHIHIIPRYDGDVEYPVGGVRNVIPGKGAY